MRQEKQFAPLSLRVFAFGLLLFACVNTTRAQTTSFTYQGRFTDSTAAQQPTNGTYDFQFTVYDALTGGTQQPQPSPVTVTRSGVQVTNGVFTVQLDFGSSAFPGADRFLEISVRKPSDATYTTLSPRQQLTSTPYAIRSLNATNADNATHASSADNATNATTATTATNATSATTATNFSGNLAGDVMGTQSATVVANVGGQTAANVASGATAANNATSANTADTIVKRDGSGNFSAGTITATLNGNASTATTADSATTANSVAISAGDSVISAINSSSSSITTAHVTGDVEFAPAAQQTTSSTPNHLINLGLVGSVPLGVRNQGSLLNLTASGQYPGGNIYNQYQHFFRVDNTGAFLAVGQYDGGATEPPISNQDDNYAGQTRLMWYPGLAAFRAGRSDGTEWEQANTGSYSVAFGYNSRSSGDYSFSAGERTTAANIWALAIGRYNTASGATSVALGEGAHTNARQGSFVFADRSYLGNICDTSTLIPPYGLNDAGCAATGGVNTILRAPGNNSFTVRASGGTSFYTNATATTGLRMSFSTTSNVLYGSFVWSDRSSDAAVNPTAQNQTIFRSSGGFTVYTDSGLSAGVTVGPGGGSWSSVSDRNMKENFAPVDSRSILQKVLNLPITTWNYKTQDASIRHIGAMAQDFKAAFGVGEDDRHITTIDPDGVALAAIQGLNEELKDRDRTINQQQQQINTLQTQAEQQQRQIAELRQAVCAIKPDASVCTETGRK